MEYGIKDVVRVFLLVQLEGEKYLRLGEISRHEQMAVMNAVQQPLNVGDEIKSLVIEEPVEE